MIMSKNGFYIRVTNGDTSIVFYTKKSLIKFIVQLLFCDMKKENVSKILVFVRYLITLLLGALGGNQLPNVL